MRHALNTNYYITLIITLLALVSCGGRKGELRIKGEIRGLNNADLTMYSRDGVFQGIDTLRVRQGKIDWTCPYHKENGSVTIVYPTYSTLTVFGSSGDVIHIDGDAKQLSATKVGGNTANEAYTALRLQLEEAAQETKDSIIDAFINENQESPVARMLQLQKLANQPPSALDKGEYIPEFTLVTRRGDTITNDSLNGKYTLFTFWANWRGGSSTMNFRIRRLRRQAKQPLECISYNMDVNTSAVDYVERTDSITWHSYCDQRIFQSDLASRLGVHDIPFYILTDTANRILVASNDWQKDIEPALSKITSPAEEPAE